MTRHMPTAFVSMSHALWVMKKCIWVNILYTESCYLNAFTMINYLHYFNMEFRSWGKDNYVLTFLFLLLIVIIMLMLWYCDALALWNWLCSSSWALLKYHAFFFLPCFFIDAFCFQLKKDSKVTWLSFKHIISKCKLASALMEWRIFHYSVGLFVLK